MAFKSEEDRLAYEASMQKFYKKCHSTHRSISNVGPRYRAITEGEKVNLNTNSTLSFGASGGMILLGIPCLLIPPLGIFMIVMGLVSFASGVRDAVVLGSGRTTN